MTSHTVRAPGGASSSAVSRAFSAVSFAARSTMHLGDPRGAQGLGDHVGLRAGGALRDAAGRDDAGPAAGVLQRDRRGDALGERSA